MAVKSCTDVQNDLENGKDPVTGFVHSSTQADWQGNMLNSQSYGLRAGNGLTYEAAQNTDINTAKEKVEEDNGKKGVVWVKGVKIGGNKYAGGDGQPSIKLTHDIVIAGANAMIGKDNYEDSQEFPRTSALKRYWANSDELAQWATDVLGERIITTYSGGDKTATPGKGLLAKVQVMFSGENAQEGVYQKLMNLVSGADNLNVKNLYAVSTSSVIINRDIINDLRHQSLAKRAISVNVLAQGIASGRVIDQAQMLKEVLQTAEQVPAIARNTPAQDQIQKYLSTLQDQINMVVNFKETNQKLITSSIQTIVLDQAQDKAAKSSNRPTASDRPEDLNQITKEHK